jgi:hypothetical protein
MATAKVLVIGGGGAAGGASNDRSQGGDAGVVTYDAAFTITPQTYAVTIGVGGLSYLYTSGTNPTPGGSSVFSTITSTGGKSSASVGWPGAPVPGTGGDNCGAGGTCSGTSPNAGVSNSISGSAVEYGRSNGSSSIQVGAINGAANKGEGGQGAWNSSNVKGGDGGSGVVIVRWTTADFGTCSVTGTGNAITTNGADSIATMIVSGNLVIAGSGSSKFFQLF